MSIFFYLNWCHIYLYDPETIPLDWICGKLKNIKYLFLYENLLSIAFISMSLLMKHDGKMLQEIVAYL